MSSMDIRGTVWGRVMDCDPERDRHDYYWVNRRELWYIPMIVITPIGYQVWCHFIFVSEKYD